MAAPALLAVRVVPKASRAGIEGWMDDGVLKIKVQAPPEDGKANAEVCAVLAKALGLGKRAVSLAQGDKNRSKVLAIDGLTLEEVKTRVEAALAG